MAHVVHIIPVLAPGGAENQLVTLACGQRAAGHRVEVLALTSDPRSSNELEAGDCRVISARGGVRRFLTAYWRSRRADIAHAWMYHGFLLALPLRPFGRAKHVWSIRRTNPRSSGLSLATRSVIATVRTLARYGAHALIYCSEAARREHNRAGFAHPIEVVVHNAVPDGLFAVPGQVAGGADESRDNVAVFGCLTRWNPDKGVDVVVEAWRRFLDAGGRGELVLAGPGMTAANHELQALIDDLAADSRPRLTGPTDDVAAFYAAIDIYVSPSRTEGFPNVVAEAMAAGRAVIATDVGGTREVVGEAGTLVRSEDPEALAAAMVRVAGDATLRTTLAAEGSARCRRLFRTTTMVERTDTVYELVGVTPSAPTR